MDQRVEHDSSGNSNEEPGVRDGEIEAEVTKSKRSKLNNNNDEPADKNANKGINKINSIGAVLSNIEDTTAYSFLFETVMEIAEPTPRAIMADADKASAIRNTLPASVRLTCFFHLLKNVKQRLAGVKSTDPVIYHKIMDDLQGLQAGAVDKESFSVLYRLLKKKCAEDHIYSDPVI